MTSYQWPTTGTEWRLAFHLYCSTIVKPLQGAVRRHTKSPVPTDPSVVEHPTCWEYGIRTLHLLLWLSRGQAVDSPFNLRLGQAPGHHISNSNPGSLGCMHSVHVSDNS